MICAKEPVIFLNLHRDIPVKYNKKELLEKLKENENYLQK